MKTLGRFELLFLAATSTLLGACADNTYLFRPAQQATANVSGLPAARYSIPPEKPQGEVLVVSTGVTEIKPENSPQRALFARVIVTNNTDETPWRIDTRKQAAVFGNNRVAPTYVNTFGEALPIVQIAKGEKRTLDFYFPVPAGTETNGDISQFDLSWNVETSGREIAERTAFDRYKVEPVYRSAYASGPYVYPYGRWGWYDPYYGPYPYWGPSVGVYYGTGWGWGRGYYGGGYYGGGHYGGGGIGGGGRGGGYTRPSVGPR